MNTSDKNFLGCESCVWWGKGQPCKSCLDSDKHGNPVYRLYHERTDNAPRDLPADAQPQPVKGPAWGLFGSVTASIAKSLLEQLQQTTNERHPS